MRRWCVLLAIGAMGCSGASSMAPSPAPSSPPPIVAPMPIPVVRDPARFDQTFWNEFVHNAYEAPAAHLPLQRLPAAPMIYLKTVDEAGQPIDAMTLRTVEDALRFIAPTWSGGQFGLAGVERGPATREGQRGWLTVKWPNPVLPNLCGRASVGLDGGAIELNYLQGGTCACNGSKIRPHTVYHELGHAFGYWHTDRSDDLMFSSGQGCDVPPSAREIYHATVAYQSPIGTTTALPVGHVTIED